MPRHSSGSTYETVVFRRQSLYKEGAKINGTYQTRTVLSPRHQHLYFQNGSRNGFDYQDITVCEDNPSSTIYGKKVLLSIENDYVKLQSLTRNFHQSDATSLYI